MLSLLFLALASPLEAAPEDLDSEASLHEETGLEDLKVQHPVEEASDEAFFSFSDLLKDYPAVHAKFKAAFGEDALLFGSSERYRNPKSSA